MVVGHAAVVERTIHIGDRALRAGYVEAVATAPDRQGSGVGTRVMDKVGGIIRDGYDLGALGTGAHRFYGRLGWGDVAGPSVRPHVRRTRGPDEEFIMVLRTPLTPDLDMTAPISCEWRPGDVWWRLGRGLRDVARR